MRLLRFRPSNLVVALALAFFLLAFNPKIAAARDMPSDLCSLLPTQQLQKTLGERFGPAEKLTAPPASSGQAAGMDCSYKGQKTGRHEVIFIVYVDHSPEESKQAFKELSTVYPSISKPSGIGDAAYIDTKHAIHVRKGNVRYFIYVNSGASNAALDKQVEELAASVAAQI